MYRLFFRVVLSRLDPEFAHHLAFLVIRWLPILGIGSLVRRTTRPAPGLGVTTLGLEFDSPFGIAAGFDKDARGIRGLGQLGFGHVEIGSVTAIAQPGNDNLMLLYALVIVVIGGLGSLKGAAVGALLVGQVQTLGVAMLSGYASFLMFAVMALVLLLKPAGLLPSKHGHGGGH